MSLRKLIYNNLHYKYKDFKAPGSDPPSNYRESSPEGERRHERLGEKKTTTTTTKTLYQNLIHAFISPHLPASLKMVNLTAAKHGAVILVIKANPKESHGEGFFL